MRNKRKVLITGGSGFLGRFVVDSLKTQGMEVVSVDVQPGKNETLIADVTDFTQINNILTSQKPEVIIHLAALAGSTGKGGGVEGRKRPFNYFKTNIMGTLCIFEACRINNIKKVIHMSSFSQYGITKEPINEETKFNPNNPYGFSKACGEMVAKCYAIDYGIKTMIFRAPLICGEGQRELNALREFVQSVKEGKPIILFGTGEHVREWIHPTDVADAFMKAIPFFNSMVNPYEVFVLGNKPISMNDLAELVINTMGIGTVEHKQITKQVFNQYTDTDKASKLLGWKAKMKVNEIVNKVVQDIFQK
jgi:nucleoside-diphosphate-sugar epimerase